MIVPVKQGPAAMDLRIAIIGAGKLLLFLLTTHRIPQSVDTTSICVLTGMGGLASALALAQKGFRDIHVYENARSLGFVGAGIQLAPNLVRVLTRLGCWDAIEAEATDVLETSIRGTLRLENETGPDMKR